MSIPEISAWTGNIYLGEKVVAKGNCWHWIITKNTILFVPFTEDLTDHWPNEFALTNTWVQLVQNQANVKVWYFNWSSYLSWANSNLFNFGDMHIWVWVKFNSFSWSQFRFSWIWSWDIFAWYQTRWSNWIWVGRNAVAWDTKYNIQLSSQNWYYISIDRISNSLNISVNASSIWSGTNSNNYITTWWYQIGNDWTWNYVNWYISNLIIENKWWSTDEETDYFNWNKWKYGL